MQNLTEAGRTPPENPNSVKAVYDRALKDFQAGRVNEARGGFEMVLATRPDLAEAAFQLGRALAAQGSPDAARTAFDAALALKPAEPALWLALVDLARAGRDRAGLSALLRRARVAGLPAPLQARLAARASGQRQGAADSGRKGAAAAMTLLRQGKPAEAAGAAAAIARAQPGSAAAQAVLGIALATLRRPQEAEAAFRRALARDPGDADTAANLADLLLSAGRLPEAAEVLAPVVAEAPKHARARSLYGRALTGLDRLPEAETELEAAARLDPADGRTQAFLGTLRLRQERPHAAVAPLRAALKAGVSGPRTLTEYGKALSATGETEAATAAFAEALAKDPDFSEALAARAMQSLYAGAFEAAEADFEAAIARDPANGAFYRMAAGGRKFEPGDPMLARMEAAWSRPDLSLEARGELAFALAKAMEDTGQTDRVFGFLDAANVITRARFAYDIRQDAAGMRALCNAFANAPAAPAPGGRGDGPVPIFVTGLPRSGTTLVEQILSAHSRVTGAGELVLFTDCLNAHMPAITGPGGAPAPVFAEVGRAYTARLAERFAGADRVTDKSIGTFQALGYVPLALPDARVVVVRRDPRDIGLSLYRNRFADGGHGYAADLRDIGLYLRLYEEVMAFWRQAAPEAFHEIAYEALIADPEGEARQLVAACDLDWEDACLSFHENTRRVDTLSVRQVRQPIYQTSVSGWQKYEAELAPMLEVLADDTPLLFPAA